MGRFLKPVLRGHPGYERLYVTLCNGSGRPLAITVHQLVMLAFVGHLRPGQEVRHLDGNPFNNAGSPATRPKRGQREATFPTAATRRTSRIWSSTGRRGLREARLTSTR